MLGTSGAQLPRIRGFLNGPLLPFLLDLEFCGIGAGSHQNLGAPMAGGERVEFVGALMLPIL